MSILTSYVFQNSLISYAAYLSIITPDTLPFQPYNLHIAFLQMKKAPLRLTLRSALIIMNIHP